MHLRAVVSLLVPALALLGRVDAAPSGDYASYEPDFNETTLFSNGFRLVARQDKRPELRIMALGASIVTGVGSSSGNGYVTNKTLSFLSRRLICSVVSESLCEISWDSRVYVPLWNLCNWDLQYANIWSLSGVWIWLAAKRTETWLTEWFLLKARHGSILTWTYRTSKPPAATSLARSEIRHAIHTATSPMSF